VFAGNEKWEEMNMLLALTRFDKLSAALPKLVNRSHAGVSPTRVGLTFARPDFGSLRENSLTGKPLADFRSLIQLAGKGESIMAEIQQDCTCRRRKG
jgi:hypothetical protein